MVDLARIRNGGLKGLFMACQLSMITDSTDLINWKIHICWSCISICSNLFSQWHVELCEKFLPVLTIELVVPFLRLMLAVRSYWIMPSAMDCTLLIIWKIMKMAYCGPWITLVCAVLIHHQLYMAYMYSYTYISLNSPFNECNEGYIIACCILLPTLSLEVHTTFLMNTNWGMSSQAVPTQHRSLHWYHCH